MEFEPFPKLARLSREVIITEKLDGTNAQIAIDEDGNIRAGSRTRWIYPSNDNFGFALWVEQNKSELLKLGPGRHFGEWWGQGIQRKYDLDEKRFSLFNVTRWRDNPDLPACCHVVPTLYTGIFMTQAVVAALGILELNGSQAAPGFMRPEGIVIYHTASRQLFKKTLENDDVPKSLAA